MRQGLDFLAVELVGELEVESFERPEDGGPGGGAQAALQLRAEDDAALLSPKGCLGRRAVMESGEAGINDGVPLVLGAEVLLPGFAGEFAAVRAGGELGFETFGEASDVLLWDPEKEAAPVNVRWKQVIVGDEDGGDAGAHDFEETDAAGSGAAGAEDEVRGGEGFCVVTLPVGSIRLGEIPVEVG